MFSSYCKHECVTCGIGDGWKGRNRGNKKKEVEDGSDGDVARGEETVLLGVVDMVAHWRR